MTAAPYTQPSNSYLLHDLTEGAAVNLVGAALATIGRTFVIGDRRWRLEASTDPSCLILAEVRDVLSAEPEAGNAFDWVPTGHRAILHVTTELVAATAVPEDTEQEVPR